MDVPEVLNLSSILGLAGVARRTDYCSSKGAVRMMTKADALTFAQDKIRVNSLHPGLTWTPLVESTWIKMRGFTKEQLVANVPLGRGADPLEIAYGILFLISDESSFMTGSELVMDGGGTAQ